MSFIRLPQNKSHIQLTIRQFSKYSLQLYTRVFQNTLLFKVFTACLQGQSVSMNSHLAFVPLWDPILGQLSQRKYHSPELYRHLLYKCKKDNLCDGYLFCLSSTQNLTLMWLVLTKKIFMTCSEAYWCSNTHWYARSSKFMAAEHSCISNDVTEGVATP